MVTITPSGDGATRGSDAQSGIDDEDSQEGGASVPDLRASMGGPPAGVPPPAAFSAAAQSLSQKIEEESESEESAHPPDNFDNGPRPSELGL